MEFPAMRGATRVAKKFRIYRIPKDFGILFESDLISSRAQ